jgi:hypothetical protein
MELIKDNYLRGSGHGDTWHVEIDPPKRKVKSYFEETLITSEYMYANKSGKLFLLYSGGLDSQYVFNVFMHLGFDFTPVIIQLTDKTGTLNYNHHETKYAYEHCRAVGITPKTLMFDYDTFVDSGEILEVANAACCGSFHLPATMKAAQILDGFIIFGNDPPYMKYNQHRDVWQLEETEKIHSILKFFKHYNVAGSPFLLSYTPEMMLSFLLDPTMVSLANRLHPGKLGTNSTKVHVFNNGSNFNMPNYDFVNKTRIKCTGYEFIDMQYKIAHPNLQKFIELENKWNGMWYEDYHSIVPKLSIYQ